MDEMQKPLLVALVLTVVCGSVAVAGGNDVVTLLKKVEDVNVEAKDLAAAVRSLGELRSAEAVVPLAALLKHKNEHVRDETMYALVRIGKPSVPALAKLVGDATELPATVDESYTAHKYPDYVKSRRPLGWRQMGPGKLYAPVALHVNRYAIRALGLIGHRGALKAIDEAESKFSGNRWIRDECRRARIAILGEKTPLSADMRPWMLAEIGNPAAADALVASVAGSLRKTSKGNIAEKFGPYTDFGGSAPADAIRRIDALGVLRSSRSSDVLLRLANEGVHNDWQWLHAGMHDLVDHFHGIGVGWDGHWMAPLAACRALGESGVKQAIPALKKRLADKNILVRLSAARALAQLGDESGLQTALRASRWMHVEFVSDFDKKGKPWLQHWVNEDQSRMANHDSKYPGKTWFRPVPNYQYLLAYDSLGHIGNRQARDKLKQRANEILALRGGKFFNEYYQTDLLWLASALNRIGQRELAKRALDAGMELFAGERATSVHLRHFHMAALPALAKINDRSTLDAVGRVLAHHQTTWRPGTYDIRDLAWGVYLTLVGRRDPNKPLRCSELCWLH